MAVKVDYKYQLLSTLLSEYPDGAKVLDLGSGTSKDFAQILEQNPKVSYVGVEFNGESRTKAAALIGHLPNVTLLDAFGETLDNSLLGTFDICISLSVLEHVKNLGGFLEMSVRAVRPGGRVIHRYDLGHALFPSSLRERLLVAFCRYLPIAAGARNFTTYPSLSGILERLRGAGARIDSVDQSQVHGLKLIMNQLDWTDPQAAEIAQRIVSVERDSYAMLAKKLPPQKLDRYFPTITIWSTKER